MKHFLYALSLFLVSSLLSVGQTYTSTGSMNTDRFAHETQLLYTGNVLAFGGDNFNGINQIVYKSAQLYNPSTGTWSNTGSMNKLRTEFASVVLPNGNVMAIGGQQTMAVEPSTASCEIYNVQTGTWSYTDSMHIARSYHNAIALRNGKILVVGGIGGTSCELYNPSTNKWSFTASPSLVGGDGTSLVMLADGKILATSQHDAEIFNPDTETWTLLSAKLIGNREGHSSVLLNNGNVLITGGYNIDDQTTAELFNITTMTFIATAEMSSNRAISKAILLDNGKVMAYGLGDFLNPTNTKLIELYDPATGTWSLVSQVFHTIGTQGYNINKLGNGKILISGGSATTLNGAASACFLVDQNLSPCTLPSISLTATGQSSCYGNAAGITLNTSESGVTYKIKSCNTEIAQANGTGSLLTIPIAASAIQAGDNIYTIYANRPNCTSLSLTDTASIKATITTTKPVITISANIICAGDSAKLSAPAGYSSYNWSTRVTTAFIYVKNITDYSVEVTASNGCKSLPSDAVHITVNPVVTTSISISASKTTIIAGDPVTFTATSTNGGSTPVYTWNINNVASGNGSTFSTTTLQDGDIVSCTLLSSDLCAKPASLQSNLITMIVKPFVDHPKVVSTFPTSNALNVSASQAITVTFSKPMSDAAATNSIVAVHGSYSGKLKGTYTKTGNTITFTSNQYYLPGEKISVLIDSAASDATGIRMKDGYVSEFTVTASVAPATFTSGTDIQLYRPTKVISADLNNDGLIDIIALPASGGIVTRFNQGNGIFSSLVGVDPGYAYVYSVNATDLNNDGFVDICASYMNDKIITIYTNNKEGGFIKQNFTTSVSGENISTGDFNGDGKIDIVIQNYYTTGQRGVAILWNKNNGDFSISNTMLNIRCNNYKTGDFDNDGDLDILTCNGGPITYLKNDGKGSFTNFNIPLPQKGYEATEIVALGDFDKNGYLDPIVRYNTSFGIIKNMGNDTFASFDSIGTASPAYAVHQNPVADFDGDGDLDLAFTNFSIGNVDTLDIWTNNGNGGFVRYSRKTLTGVYQILFLTAADFDTDGDIDIATANLESSSISILLNGGTKPSIANLAFTESTLCASSSINIIGNSSGTFAADNVFQLQLSDKNGSFNTPIDLGLPQKELSTLMLAQLPASLEAGSKYRMRIVSTNPYIESKDNGFDITIKTGCFVLTGISPENHTQNINLTENIQATFSNNVLPASPNLSIYGSLSGSYSANKGSFTKTGNTVTFTPGSDFFAGEKIYVTADTSIKSANGDKLIQPYLSTFTAKANTAPALFTHYENITKVLNKTIIAVGDLDNDHNIDFILTDVITDSLSFYMNAGDGTFTLKHSMYISNEYLCELGDFDRDGDLDLTIIDANNYIQIFQNDGHANFTQKQAIVTGSALTKNCDINSDGHLDIVSLNRSYDKFDIFLNDGKGNLYFQKSYPIQEYTWSFLVDDMDNDGDIDIIYGTGNHLAILYNRNNANSFLKTIISSGNWEIGNALCDINSDGFIDIIGTTTMLFNDINQTFSTSKTMDWQFQAFVIGVADFNGDAKSDLLVSDGLSSRIFTNNGASDFVERTKLWNTYNTFPGDVDNDGDIDIIGFDNLDRKIGSLINELSLKTVVVSEQTFCSISKIEISFQNRGVPNGTTLSAQLSDANGSFNTFQVIGTGKASPIVCSVPSTVPVGTGYRIRIVCDSLNLISTDNGINLTITTGCPVVQTVSPLPNSNSVEQNATIQATFTTNLLASSINTNAIRIYGNKSGFKSIQQDLSLLSPSTIQYQTSSLFAAGEKVSVSLTHEIKNTDGIPLIAPYVYEFNIKPTISSGNYLLTENIYTNKSPGRSNIFKSGDFNNDGKGDLLIADLSNNKISILLNGTTSVVQFVSTASYIGDINIFDIDGDGDLDFSFIDIYSSTPFYIYKNDGQANFTLAEKLQATGGAGEVVNADFNGDGNLDFITANTNNLAVGINNGHGIFNEKYIIQTADMNIYPSPKNLFVTTILPADIDSDGDIDLLGTAYTTNGLNFIITLLNDGQGKFTIQDDKVSITEGINYNNIKTGDFNNDGKIDFIFQASYSAKTIGVGINTNGSFVISTFAINEDFNLIETADIDGDSDIDLIIVSTNRKNTITYKNNGAASFTLFESIPVPVDSYILDIEPIDIDTDGDLDLALTTNTDLLILLNAEPSIITQPLSNSSICGGEAFPISFTTLGIPSGNTFKAELSDATGSFANPTIIGTGATSPLNVTVPTSIAAGSAYRIRIATNNLSIIGTDNGTDINIIQGCLFIAEVTPNANSNNVTSVNSIDADFTTTLAASSVTTQSFRIFGSYSGFDSNKGTISLPTPSSITFNADQNFFPNERVAVSLTKQIKNTDNIALSKPYIYEFYVKPAASNGNFFLRQSTQNSSINFALERLDVRNIESGDLDNDGDLDIIMTNTNTDQLSIYLNHTNTNHASLTSGNVSTFTTKTDFATGDQPQTIQLIDMDHDGDLDIFTINMYNISVFKNNSDGTFESARTLTLSDRPEGITIADFNGDGFMDFATCTFSTGLSININDGVGNFTESTFAFLTDGHAFAVEAMDIDADGDMDLAGTTFSPFNTMTFENDGNAHFTLKNTLWTLAGSLGLLTADFNNDGKMDFITSQGLGNGGGFDIGLNQGGSFIKKHIDFWHNQMFFDVGDVDGDGDMDIITGSINYTEGLTILKNDGSATFTATSIPIYTSLYASILNDVDNDGDLDIVSANTDPNNGLLIFYNGSAPVELSTGTSNASTINIRIYPNPAQDFITIDSPILPEKIILYNILGNEVLQAEQTTQINVSELAPGIYNIKVITDKGTCIQKMCIE